ncbi:MAG: permease [Bacteroidales bacterium]
MMQDFGKWLIIGLVIAAAITAFIPDSVFTLFKDYYLLNILLILLISAPMYICATGSIPIALSLLLKGVSPGAAFVLLMAGPATNIASLIILKKEIGIRKTAIYLIAIIIGAIACALFIDFALPQEWFTGLVPLNSCTHEHHNHDACSHGPIWRQTTTSILFITLFVNSIIQKYLKRN